MKIILVPVDFSPVTADVVEQAARLAEAFSAALWLLHVAAPEPDFVGYETGPPNVREQVAHEMRDSHRRLQEHSSRLRARGIDATALQVQGPTTETILHEAERLKADMIVLGSHGHGAVHRALLGSVSEGVLHRAACPVLILPSRRATT
jgi:nucleotide-binding universal stress UspA family protein